VRRRASTNSSTSSVRVGGRSPKPSSSRWKPVHATMMPLSMHSRTAGQTWLLGLGLGLGFGFALGVDSLPTCEDPELVILGLAVPDDHDVPDQG
jgi:hypothetical protein